MNTNYSYLNGFGNEFESEAKDYEGAIPRNLINPQRCKFNLFAEQLSGSAFTAPRCSNRRTWFYRVHPSVGHEPFVRLEEHHLDYASGKVDPNQMRWAPFELDPESGGGDFVESMHLLAFSNQSATSAIRIFVFWRTRTSTKRVSSTQTVTYCLCRKISL
uniref:Homogentisate 1,2-dioxygenase n=1 Tax=Aceria tosichella TaxID=561515 RepID=A0A6G1SHI9_9ACAR